MAQSQVLSCSSSLLFLSQKFVKQVELLVKLCQANLLTILIDFSYKNKGQNVEKYSEIKVRKDSEIVCHMCGFDGQVSIHGEIRQQIRAKMLYPLWQVKR